MDGIPDGKGEETVMAEVTRDPTYFFPLESLIVLKVENTLFRIHLSHLLKHSEYFKGLYKSPSSPSTEVFTEANPFVVDHTVSVREFRHFLRIIFSNTVTVDLEDFWTSTSEVRHRPTASNDEWMSVLKISTLWRCLGLRRLAIRNMNFNDSTERIVWGRKYSVSVWVVTGYCWYVQRGGISDEQMEVIGLLESFKLLRIALEYQGRYKKEAFPMDQKIKEAFQEEFKTIAAAEEALSNT